MYGLCFVFVCLCMIQYNNNDTHLSCFLQAKKLAGEHLRKSVGKQTPSVQLMLCNNMSIKNMYLIMNKNDVAHSKAKNSSKCCCR